MTKASVEATAATSLATVKTLADTMAAEAATLADNCATALADAKIAEDTAPQTGASWYVRDCVNLANRILDNLTDLAYESDVARTATHV
jgi:hypothetical protein